MLNEIQKIGMLLTEFNTKTITLSFDEETKYFVAVLKSKDYNPTVFKAKTLENIINQLLGVM